MESQPKSAKDFLKHNDAVIDHLRVVMLGEFDKGPVGLRQIIKELTAVQVMASEGEQQTLFDCLSDISNVLLGWIDDPIFLEQLPQLRESWADVVSELANFFVFMGEEDETELRNRVNYRLVQLAKASAALAPPLNLANQTEADGSWGLFDEGEIKAEVVPTPEPVATFTPVPPAAPASILPMAKVAAEPLAENALASHYLICLLGSQQYALPIHQVREILEERQEKALPAQRPGIVGLVTVRGLVCPVVDVSHILHAKNRDESGEDQKKRCMIVCEVDRKTFCFNVDDVKQVASLDEFQDQITPLTSESTVQKAISHVAHFQNKSVLFVKMREVIPA